MDYLFVKVEGYLAKLVIQRWREELRLVQQNSSAGVLVAHGQWVGMHWAHPQQLNCGS